MRGKSKKPKKGGTTMIFVPRKISLPNGLTGKVYPPSHRRVSQVMRVCLGLAASTPKITLNPDDLKDGCVLELNLATTTLHIVFAFDCLVQGVNALEKLLRKYPEHLDDCILGVVYEDQFYYWASDEARIICRAINEKTSPGAYLLLNTLH